LSSLLEAEQRHAEHYLNIIYSLIEWNVLGDGSNRRTQFQLERERNQILKAQTWAEVNSRINDIASALCIGYAIAGESTDWFLPPAEYIRWLQVALAASSRMINPQNIYNTISLKPSLNASRYNPFFRKLPRILINGLQLQRTLFNQLGDAYLQALQPEHALPYFQRDLAVSRRNLDRKGEVRAYANMAEAYRRLRRYEEAIKSCKRSLRSNIFAGDTEGFAVLMLNLGAVYFDQGKYKKAQSWFTRALLPAIESGDKAREAQILGNLGNICLVDKKYTSGSLESWNLLKFVGNLVNRFLGSANSNYSPFEQAKEYYLRGLQIAEEVGDKQIEGMLLNNLGNMYRNLEQFEIAVDYTRQALKVSREIGDKVIVSNSLGNLGLVYAQVKEYERAINYLQQAQALSHEINDKFLQSTHLSNLAHVYTNSGQSRKATDCYRQTLEISSVIKSKQKIAMNWRYLRLLNTEDEQPEQTIDYYFQSGATYKTLGLLKMIDLSNRKIDSLHSSD